MKLNLRVLANVFLLCLFLYVEAKELSFAEVIDRVQSSSQVGMMRKVKGGSKLSISYVQYLEDKDKVAYCVLDKGDAQGFLIAPADDVFPVVLGYTDTGNFDIDSIPPALKWYLEQFEKTVEGMSTVYSITSIPDFSEDWNPIEPLLTTKWGQGYPYNMDCPSYNGYQFPTGCVPTAVAQIMNYHKWPYVGEGTGSTEFNGDALTLDFETISFDWSSMEDDYYTDSQDQSKNAVAELMYSCGVGIKACYGFFDMTGGSIIGARYFLTENMKYASDIKVCYKYNYSPYEWNELVYNDLKNGYPVYCEGAGDGLGHAFVCDGYDGNGYFHINWGWNGYADGYFLLTDLNPTSEKDNYHKDMMLLTNIHKRTGEKQPLSVDLISQGEFKIDKYGRYAFDNIFNYSLKDFQGYFGIKAVSKDGDCLYFEYEGLRKIPASQLGYAIAIAHTGQYDYYWIPLDGRLPAGEYKLYQTYREVDGDYCDIKGLYGSPNCIDVVVDESGICTFLSQEFNYDIEVTSVVVNGGYGFKPGLAYAGHELYDLSMTFVNNMDVPYNSGVTYRITKDDMLIGTDEINFLLQPHSALRAGKGNYIVRDHKFKEGEYKIEVFDYGGKRIDSEDFFFTVIEEPTPNLKVTDFSWEKNEKRDRLTIFTTIENLSEHHYQGEFEIKIDPPVFDNRHVWINGVESGGFVELDWDFWNAEATFTEDAYQVYFYDHLGHPINTTPLWMVLNDTAGIRMEEIRLDAQELTIEVGNTYQFAVEFVPENASYVDQEWWVDDESIATVTPEGLLSVWNEGKTQVHVRSAIWKEIESVCTLNATTDVERLLNDAMPCLVYTIGGNLVKDDIHVGDLNDLERGIYILVQGDKRMKLIR